MNIKVLFSVRAHKYNHRVGETDTGRLWMVSCIFHLVVNSHNQKDPAKMEGLWKITMMNLQAARYMLSSQAPLPSVVCCLLKPVTKVDYIFFCLCLFPVSLAVNKEVECLGETALIIEVWNLFISLDLRFLSPFIFADIHFTHYFHTISQLQPTPANINPCTQDIDSFLDWSPTLRWFQVLAKVLTTKHISEMKDLLLWSAV